MPIYYDFKNIAFYINVVDNPEIPEGFEIIGKNCWKQGKYKYIAMVYKDAGVVIPRGWLRTQSDLLIQQDLKRYAMVREDTMNRGVKTAPLQVRLEVGEQLIPSWVVICGGIKLSSGFLDLEKAKEWCQKEYPNCKMNVVLGSSVEHALSRKPKQSRRLKALRMRLSVSIPQRMLEDVDTEAKLQNVTTSVIVTRMLKDSLGKLGYHTYAYGD